MTPDQATGPMPPVNSEEVRWFANQVLPHESSLRAYLRGSFPSIRDIDDVVQESYLRILRARLLHPIESARGFLFKVARHIAIDGVRRARISPIDRTRDLAGLAVIEDGPDAAERLTRQEKVTVLAEAILSLPNPCREIVILRKLKGVPQREVAAQLGITEKAVEAQVYRGIKRCESYLRKRGIRSLYENESR